MRKNRALPKPPAPRLRRGAPKPAGKGGHKPAGKPGCPPRHHR